MALQVSDEDKIVGQIYCNMPVLKTGMHPHYRDQIQQNCLNFKKFQERFDRRDRLYCPAARIPLNLCYKQRASLRRLTMTVDHERCSTAVQYRCFSHNVASESRREICPSYN